MMQRLFGRKNVDVMETDVDWEPVMVMVDDSLYIALQHLAYRMTLCYSLANQNYAPNFRVDDIVILASKCFLE